MVAAGAAAAAAVLRPAAGAFAADAAVEKAATKGKINHSVCLWCYRGFSVEQMAPVAQKLGLKAIDLLTPKQWGPLKEHGLVCSMTSGVAGGIENGLNQRENHEKIVKTLTELIDANAEAGYPNVICFSGNRRGMSDEEGLKNCAEGLKKVMAQAEQKKVTVCMELLNSKVNHKDYMCDHTAWGVELCKAVGSERFKLLYDIYHMQIMEGDVIATMKKYKDYIGHLHTGGVPGRNDIDETQELYYPAIMQAAVEVGFKGYTAQEFIPKAKEPAGMVAALTEAVKICDV
jgi:hydroxypyruvate isomerase